METVELEGNAMMEKVEREGKATMEKVEREVLAMEGEVVKDGTVVKAVIEVKEGEVGMEMVMEGKEMMEKEGREGKALEGGVEMMEKEGNKEGRTLMNSKTSQFPLCDSHTRYDFS
mgnify:CR=1 FL=1